MNPSNEKTLDKLSSKSKTIIKNVVDKYTDKDIQAIAASCYKIRSLDNKKSETRRDFVNTFVKHHDTYRRVIKTFEDIAIQTTVNGDSKKDSLAYYVQLIRNREETLGINEYLLNEVKYGFMKSITKWVDTPGDLDRTANSSKDSNDEDEDEKPKKKDKNSAMAN